MSKTKEHREAEKLVELAKVALADQRARLAAAEDAVRLIKLEVGEAMERVQDAQMDADTHLPQCMLVSVAWRSGNETGLGPVVILRKTPTGILVVRKMGVGDAREQKFQLKGGKYREVANESVRFYASPELQLRDVPKDFLPPETLGADS